MLRFIKRAFFSKLWCRASAELMLHRIFHFIFCHKKCMFLIPLSFFINRSLSLSLSLSRSLTLALSLSLLLSLSFFLALSLSFFLIINANMLSRILRQSPSLSLIRPLSRSCTQTPMHALTRTHTQKSLLVFFASPALFLPAVSPTFSLPLRLEASMSGAVVCWQKSVQAKWERYKGF